MQLLFQVGKTNDDIGVLMEYPEVIIINKDTKIYTESRRNGILAEIESQRSRATYLHQDLCLFN